MSKILNRVNSRKSRNKFKSNSELRLNIDGIKGVIDLVYKKENFVKLVDFKFGKIFNENNEIKEQYQKQLYIYSAMYFKKFGIEPSVLALQDSSFKEYPLEQKTMEYCLSLFEDLKKLNKEVNGIKTQDDLLNKTKVNDENCKYCNVKVECSPYWKSDIFESENNLDIIGEILDIKIGVNGLVLSLKTKIKNNIKIFSVPVNLQTKLKDIKRVAFFNLFKKEEKNESNFYYGKHTDVVFISNKNITVFDKK